MGIVPGHRPPAPCPDPAGNIDVPGRAGDGGRSWIHRLRGGCAPRPFIGSPRRFQGPVHVLALARPGWILGSAPCGQSTCTTAIGTTDGGVTWNTLGTLGAPLTLEKATGVSQVRFADALNGWAFWPSLWHSTDGRVT